jgi:hypothetical protein
MARPQHVGRTAAAGTLSSKTVTLQCTQASVSYVLIVTACLAIGSCWRTDPSAIIG